MNTHSVIVENLTYLHHNRCIIDNLNFTIKSKQCVVLLGANGTGKTTLLKILAGLLRPKAGKIYIEGKERFTDPHFNKNCFGFLPETPPLYHDLTVFEQLSFIAQLQSINGATARIKEVLEALHLHSVQDKLIKSLSKGYRQRVGIAQTLLHKPKVLLLDEPTQGLDPTQIDYFIELLSHLKLSCTLILSTHYFSEVKPISDHIIHFTEKRIENYDTASSDS
jgi:ABC-2 type transport system ATP-binding protein